jgi:hypothetical protein
MTDKDTEAMADATEALETGVPPGTTLIERSKIGIEIDHDEGYEGFLILDLDGERFELETDRSLRDKLRAALDRSQEIGEAQLRSAH